MWNIEDDKMEFIDVITERYSVRGYLDKEVEKEKLEYVLKAATIAPTGVNNQPFKVYVIDTKKYNDELAEIYAAEWFRQAPYALCVVAQKDKAWTRPWDGKNIADIDATIVMDHIILAATDVGLGTCYIAAFKADKAREFLKLEDNEEPVLFTPLGYGNAEPRDTPRKGLDEFVVYMD
jgi:nitroreductase